LRSIVGYVAPAFPGNQKFPAGAFHFLEQEDLAPEFCSPAGSDQSRGTCAYDDDIISFHNHQLKELIRA
jgi:hypothetical protein